MSELDISHSAVRIVSENLRHKSKYTFEIGRNGFESCCKEQGYATGIIGVCSCLLWIEISL